MKSLDVKVLRFNMNVLPNPANTREKRLVVSCCLRPVSLQLVLYRTVGTTVAELGPQIIVPRPSERNGRGTMEPSPSVRASVRPSVTLFVNTISPKLLDGFSPNQVHWIRLTM